MRPEITLYSSCCATTHTAAKINFTSDYKVNSNSSTLERKEKLMPTHKTQFHPPGAKFPLLQHTSSERYGIKKNHIFLL